MPAFREIVLTLPDLEASIRRLEEKYRISTLDFFRDPTLRSDISEDDVFEWEVFVEHRRELRELSEELRRVYISSLTKSDRSDRRSPEEVCSLAA